MIHQIVLRLGLLPSQHLHPPLQEQRERQQLEPEQQRQEHFPQSAKEDTKIEIDISCWCKKSGRQVFY